MRRERERGEREERERERERERRDIYIYITNLEEIELRSGLCIKTNCPNSSLSNQKFQVNSPSPSLSLSLLILSLGRQHHRDRYNDLQRLLHMLRRARPFFHPFLCSLLSCSFRLSLCSLCSLFSCSFRQLCWLRFLFCPPSET